MTTYISLPLSGASAYWGNAVATAGALPLSGSALGEVILVLDTESLYYWDGASWIEMVNGLADMSGPASSTDNALALFNGTTGKLLKAASAITASRALVSDGSGIPTHAATTATEIGYVSGVTSSIQTQLDAKEPTITVLPIAKGGTNSGTALSNNRVVQSSGGALVEAAAITASRALASDANGIPTHTATTATELGYLSGVTSAVQTQLDDKVVGPASATDNALVRYDSTTGKLVQNSGATLDDSANLEGVARLNATTAKFGGTGAAAASAVLELAGTSGALLLPRLTAAQIGALTGVNGMLVYNADTDRFQGYFAGAWADLHGWGS